jgi:tetratricopeptide (TPR) repeat protein
VKIFLSYGHDRNAPLVERIRRDLEAAGHSVWVDTSEIKAGEDWRRRIVDGLADSDWTLGFLSEHSTRDPGVCLDELAIALHVKGGTVATVLVEAEAAVAPPVSVSHIQWLDMQDWAKRAAEGGVAWEQWYRGKFDQLLAMLADPANQRFAGEIEELERRLQPISQAADIGALVDGFVGRDWLQARLDEWRKRADESRLFWVSGPPGVGKSAFAAWLAHHGKVNVIGLNLCRYNVDERRNPARVLRTLAFQVATRLPDFRRLLLDRLVKHDRDGTEVLRRSPAALFDWLVSDPLHLAIDGGRRADRYLVVIDALDETIRDNRSELAEVLAESAPKLPRWIAVVVTSRPEPAILRQFAALKPQTIDAESQENLEDLRAYVRGWLTAAGRLRDEPDDSVERIVAASHGNFLYLRKLREAADAGLLDLAAPVGLPQGLVGLYERWFRRQFATAAAYEQYLPLLEVLVAAEHPVPEHWLGHIFNWSTRVRARMLEGLGSLFERRSDGVAPFHKSLRDWLSDARAAGADFVVDAPAGAERLADALWAAFAQRLKEGETGALDPFCVAEMPLQIMRAPRDRVRAWLAAAQSWPDIWLGLTAVATAQAASFAWDAALAWWRMAAFLGETWGEDGRSNQGYALRMSGDIARTLGRSREALEDYRASLAMSRALSEHEPGDSELRRNIYVSLIRIGNVLLDQGDLAGALAAHREGLDIIRALAAAAPDSPQWQREVSVSLERLGEALERQGDLTGALARYREGLDIIREVAAGDPGNSRWRRDVSVRSTKIGDIMFDQTDFDGALAAYREGCDVMRALATQEPGRAAWRRDLYATLFRIGDVLQAKGDLAGALALHQEGLDTIRALVVRDPDNTEWERDLWASLIKVGEVLEDRGDVAGALMRYRESLDVMRALAALDPDNALREIDLVVSLWRLSLVDDEARGRCHEALAILERLRSQNRLEPARLAWIASFNDRLAELPDGAPA